MKRKVTHHAKMRIRERTELNAVSNNLVETVVRKGLTRLRYRGRFFQYLNRKKGQVKVYNDYIYFFSKTKRKLITVYPVPPKFLPTTQYEIPKNIINLTNEVNTLYLNYVTIKTKDNLIIQGYIVKTFIPQIMTKVTLKTEDGEIKIDIDNIEEIKPDKVKN